MTDVTELADRYIAMWNETDAARRRDIIASTWTETASYLDPLQSGEGPDGIDSMVKAIQERFPGHRFRRTSAVDAHHHCIRFGWALAPASSDEPLVAGVDFGMLASDGRLQNMTGFLDVMPAAAQGQ